MKRIYKLEITSIHTYEIVLVETLKIRHTTLPTWESRSQPVVTACANETASARLQWLSPGILALRSLRSRGSGLEASPEKKFLIISWAQWHVSVIPSCTRGWDLEYWSFRPGQPSQKRLWNSLYFFF